MSRVLAWVLRRTTVRPEERRALMWSAALFFLLLFGYMLLRPMRDVMGVRAGWGRVPALARTTLLAMLLLQPVFGALVARWPRRRFLPWVYRAFALQIVAFAAWAALAPPGDLAIAEAWFVWLSVYNLFVMSVFWGFMADSWSPEQAQRLYGAIAIGGTAGAVLGGLAFPLLRRTVLVLGGAAGERAAIVVIFVVGALVLEGAVRALRRVSATLPDGVALRTVERDPVGGGPFDGLLRVLRSPYLAGIALLVALYTLTSTWGWAERMDLVKRSGMGEGRQGDLSALTEAAAQTLTLLGQLLLTGALLPRLGVGRMLALGPLAAALCFGLMAGLPSVAAAVAFVLVTRAVHFAFAKPAQEALFSVVDRSEKYKAKSFVDTFVYRLSDWGGLESAAALLLLASGTTVLPLAALGPCALWLVVALALGHAHRRRVRAGPAQGVP